MTTAAIDIEMDKLKRFGVHDEPTPEHLIPKNAVRIYGKIIMKQKFKGNSLDKFSARMAGGGQDMPDHSFGETSASTPSNDARLATLAAMSADAQKRKQTLYISDFDITGAFLHCPLTKENCPYPIYMYIQKDLPHPLAGTWVLLKKALYGLKQSNHIFEQHRNAIFKKAGFHPASADQSIFVKIDPLDPSKKCIVPIWVDDGQGIYTHKPFWDDLLNAMTEQYGPLTGNEICTTHTGFQINRHQNGAIQLTEEGFINRAMIIHPAFENKFVSSPSDADLFHPTTDPTPVDPKLYQKHTGILMYTLIIRHDIRKEAIYLSSSNSNPTQGDFLKVQRVMAYLKSTPTIGPIFDSSEGAVLYGYADASYGVHQNGRSHSGYYLCIGKNSGAFTSYSKAQKSCVSLSSMEAEYVCLTEMCKKIVHIRQLLEDIGLPQTEPTTVFQDNKSAINLANAPAITRHSRHIHVRHHFVRHLVELNIINIVHIGTAIMYADLLTKPQPPGIHMNQTAHVMNIPIQTIKNLKQQFYLRSTPIITQ